MRQFAFIVVLVFCLKVHHSHQEIFSAVHRLKNLFETEKTVINELENVIGSLNKMVENLKKFDNLLQLKQKFQSYFLQKKKVF